MNRRRPRAAATAGGMAHKPYNRDGEGLMDATNVAPKQGARAWRAEKGDPR